MCEHYGPFLAELSLPSKEAQKYALELAAKLENSHDTNTGAKLFDKDLVADWTFKTLVPEEGNGIAAFNQTSTAGFRAICRFFQHLINKFTPTEHVIVCNHAGRLAFITAEKSVSLCMSDWLRDMKNGQTENAGITVDYAADNPLMRTPNNLLPKRRSVCTSTARAK